MPKAAHSKPLPHNMNMEEARLMVESLSMLAMSIEAAGSLKRFRARQGDELAEMLGFEGGLDRAVPPSRGGKSTHPDADRGWSELVRIGIDMAGPQMFASAQEYFALGRVDGSAQDLFDLLAATGGSRVGPLSSDTEFLEDLGWM